MDRHLHRLERETCKMRILLLDGTGTFLSETIREPGDAMSAPPGVIPVPYDWAPEAARMAADAALAE